MWQQRAPSDEKIIRRGPARKKGLNNKQKIYINTQKKNYAAIFVKSRSRKLCLEIRRERLESEKP